MTAEQLEERTRWVLDRLCEADWNVHVWARGAGWGSSGDHAPGSVDVADRRRVVARVLELLAGDGVDLAPPRHDDVVVADPQPGGCYPCTSCGNDQPREALLDYPDGNPDLGSRWHTVEAEPGKVCGPVACDECFTTEFEPWRDDPRYLMCKSCKHVCAHDVGVGL